MTQTTALLFGVHAHQPVGNFPFVMDDAHRRCYQPFLHMMYRFPDFPFAIHISGWLFDYLNRHYPDDIALLREMVQRGQAEIFGAGYTEPVLAAIPVRDRIGQIERMAECMEQALGQRPAGAWLTERVWEAGVVAPLAECGVQYVTVDDYHFLCAGKENAELTGYFTTEDNGRRLDLFPISEALRYRLPFAQADEVVRYLESLAGEPGSNAAIYFDDIEKFGIWPETYEWVYERGWLTSFIEGVLNSGIIRPMRYSDYHAEAKTRGVVYLPTTSYIEMNEWTLPAGPAHRYADLVKESRQQGHYEQDKAFLRGGMWRNFFTRYPESNWMHKRMLQLSARCQALPSEKRTAEMRDALYEAQANDAYWHGLFGGLYLPHLRRAVYNAIVRLEGMLDGVEARPGAVAQDVDMDGYDEIFLQNGVLQAIVMGDGTASVCELDAYALRHNFGDTLSRQTEHYHRKVSLNQSSQHQGQGIANPHEHVSYKHEILPEDMVFDSHRRSLLLDRLLVGKGAERLLQYRLAEMDGNSAKASFVSAQPEGAVGKSYELHENSLVVNYRFDGTFEGRFEIELNLAMPSCDGPAGCFKVNGEINGGFGQAHRHAQCSEIMLMDEVLGGSLEIAASRPAMVRSAPCFSVSQSEGGFEKIMQAVTLHFSWPMAEIKDGLSVTLKVA
ncbi:MAG TPA: alpha-amylase/4-alpha-glucanotransferase domain-containing protein [Gallionellaceae bacterium]